MPGTIQVSVLELMEPPPSASPALTDAKTRSLSLKVTAGKREYETVGKMEITFPVVSLRENLVVMLYSLDGNLLSRIEFKTLSVVERGMLDDTFPLEGGGTVRVRLQFLLSEEERLRIHELRNSTLRRKHGEMLKEGLERDNIKDMMLTCNAEHNIEGTVITQPKHADQDECSNPSITQGLEKHSRDSENDACKLSVTDKGKSKRISAIKGFQERDTIPEDSSDLHREFAASLGPRNAREEIIPFSIELKDHIQRNEKNPLARSTRSNIWKMISAFENSLSQGLGHPVDSGILSVGKNQNEQSLKRISSEESMEKKFFGQTMAKSFSVETLSDNSLQDNLKIPERPHHENKERRDIDNATKLEDIVNYNQILDFEKKVKNKGSDQKNKSLHAALCQTSESIIKVQKPIMTDDNICLGGSIEQMNVQKLKAIYAGHDPCNEAKPRMDKAHACYMATDQNVGNEVNAFLHKNQNEDRKFQKETNRSRSITSEAVNVDPSTRTYQQECLINTAPEDLYCRSCRGHYEELVSGNSFESIGLFYTQTEEYLWGTLGIWAPRHLCITTGSKQLRNLLESCRICLRSLSAEDKSMDRNIHEHYQRNSKDYANGGLSYIEKMFSDSSVSVIKNENVSRSPRKLNHENLVSTSNSNGRLIDQGVRIIIVIIACGTLLLRAI
uniref:Uncharacterized protein n=1 Tax=Musa acuminata subsp. malaccensis TaxID=214687 RepID=A0A804IML1_MUSAM|nr:PREDICTED: uncharacterized protein LOC103980967 isoform X1 [Musa acuminata subsp. malaccensis]